MTDRFPEAVEALWRRLLNRWNARDAAGMAKLFAEGGSMVGFDGSPVDGRAQIEGHLAPIFRDHPTAAFVGKLREVRPLGADAALLRAVAGMVPPGGSVIMADRNVVQSLTAVRGAGGWQVAMFQNTPAAFHGRPEAVEALTEELRSELKA